MKSTESKFLASVVKHLQNEEDDPLTALIDEYMKKRNLPKYRHLRLDKIELDLRERVRPGGRLSPSTICGCERQAAFKFLGVMGKKRHDPEAEMIFEDGHWRHYKWGVIFMEMERILGRHRFRVIGIEIPITIDGLMIAGSLDVEIKIKVNGKWRRYVVDFKGANRFAFDKAYRERTPNPTYLRQLLTYMKSRKCKRGMLLFEGKDTNQFFVFPIKVNDSHWAEIRMWCRSILKQMESNKIPPKHPDCNKGNFLSMKCPYKSLCYGNYSDRQLAHHAYKDFPGLEALWEQGLEDAKG